MPLKPTDLPPVELESMNRDHKDQVEMVNAVVAALDAFDGSESAIQAVDEAVEDFTEHTTEHFRHEEDEMKKFQFPAFQMHKAEHDRAIEKMRLVTATWATDRNVEAMKPYFEREFPAWLIGHVTAMDAISAQFVAGNSH